MTMRSDFLGLGVLTPGSLVTFARGQGWAEMPSRHDDVKAFVVPGSPSPLLIPLDDASPNFLALADLALDRFEVATDRSRRSLMTSVVFGSADTWEIRALGGTDAGTLPLSNLTVFASGVQAAIKDMTKSSLSRLFPPARRAVRPSLRSVLDGLQAGQTDVGSYILTVVAPLGPVVRLDDELIDAVDAPVLRLVTQDMAYQLAAARTTIERAVVDGSDDSVHAIAGEAGVTAELFTTIADTIEALDSGIDFRLRPAPERPLDAAVPTLSQFATPHVPMLRWAAETLTVEPPRPKATILGIVKGVQRDVGAQSAKVSIHGLLSSDAVDYDREFRTVSVRVEGGGIDTAIRSLNDQTAIEAAGVIEAHHRHLYLENVTQFDGRPDVRYHNIVILGE